MTVLVALTAALPVGGGILARLAKGLDRFGRRPMFCGLALFVFSLTVVALLASRRGLPMPYVHDEFSYLLAADTFAHGRLTNPVPPAWEHFESMHILVRPTYQSKYPPAQGLIMALGQVLFGHPITGVWISTAGAVVAIWWALRGFVTARWALWGGIVAAVHPQILEWGQRYWGGSIALGAGALVLGAAGRVLRSPSRVSSALGGLGIVLLAWSRPFEGSLFTLLVAVWIARRLVSGRLQRPFEIGTSRPISTTLIPLSLVVLSGLAWLGYYNYRVTGSALRLPYAEHHAQYGSAPLFIFQKARPPEQWPTYRNPQMQQFAHDQHYDYARRDNWPKVWRWALSEQLAGMAITAFGNVWPMALPLLLLPTVVRADRRLRGLLAIVVLFSLLLLVETYMHGHYVAPAGALVLLVVLMATRWMWCWGGPGGRLLVRVTASVAMLWSVFWWIGFWGWMQVPANWREDRKAWTAWRDYVMRDFLGERPGRHLAIVRYSPTHFVHNEWVYNGADLNEAKVIWARDLGDKANRKLLAAFPDRQAWLVEPEGERIDPIPYTVSTP